ncbi:hypothetical protein SRABI03_02473 [Microbacterium foliorum]|nr:hypothetical protein SRABI03_02473 [Microbacterium foliorum]
MGGRPEHPRRRTGLDDPAVAEHLHALADLCDDGEVVRDQDEREVALPAEPPQQLEKLGLHRDVESGRRLVGDQHGGVGGERHRDQHALQHAARELRDALAQHQVDAADAEVVEQLARPRPGPSSRHTGGHAQGLFELRPDRNRRVQIRGGVLEDRADARAAHRTPLPLPGVSEVEAVDLHRAPGDRQTCGEDAQQGPAGERLAAARFADDAEGVTGAHRHGDALHQLGAVASADDQVGGGGDRRPRERRLVERGRQRRGRALEGTEIRHAPDHPWRHPPRG